MKNIICFLSGIVAGIAMCLTAAYYLPESIWMMMATAKSAPALL